MKKALLLLAIATMATNLMAQGESAKAKVEVKAEIVSGGLTITDISGRPLVLDLGQANKGEAKGLSNSVEYKVTSKDKATAEMNLTMTLEKDNLDIYNADADLTQADLTNDKLTVKLALDNPSKKIALGQKVATGTISGATMTTANNTAGVYSNFTYITAIAQ